MASNLQETKVMLLLAGRHLNNVYSCVCDAVPSYTNTMDAPLTEELHEIQADLRAMNARVNRLAGKI